MTPKQMLILDAAIKKFGVVQVWPNEFQSDTWETAYNFVLRLRTYNEAAGEAQRIPDKEYLRGLTILWHHAVSTGDSLIIEKCRRMLASWVYRGLELWRMGIGRFDHVLCGIDFTSSASHCWRYLELWNNLQKDEPGWKLKSVGSSGGPTILRARGDRFLESFSLPNGSITTIHNQAGGGLQGEGKSLVTMEELSRYTYPAQIWAQAHILTRGSALGKSGARVAITNAGLNPEWRSIKS